MINKPVLEKNDIEIIRDSMINGIQDGRMNKYQNTRILKWPKYFGSIKIKLQENSQPLYISQMEDFKKYFPDIDFHSL